MPERQTIPAVTAAQMASVDRIMTGELGLDVLQLMELAGRAVAVFARDRFLDGDARGRRVVVLGCAPRGFVGVGLGALGVGHPAMVPRVGAGTAPVGNLSS